MTLDEITDGLRRRVGEDSGLGATVKFDLGEAGVVFIDATTVPNVVSNEDREADCTIRISLDDFASMTAGDLDPTTAFMMGKLKIDGSMAVAMKLQGVLG